MYTDLTFLPIFFGGPFLFGSLTVLDALFAAAWITSTVVWDDDARNTCTAFTTKYFSNMLQSTHSQTDCKLVKAMLCIHHYQPVSLTFVQVLPLEDASNSTKCFFRWHNDPILLLTFPWAQTCKELASYAFIGKIRQEKPSQWLPQWAPGLPMSMCLLQLSFTIVTSVALESKELSGIAKVPTGC
jgi:hypothetical protein